MGGGGLPRGPIGDCRKPAQRFAFGGIAPSALEDSGISPAGGWGEG
jgi:hypothetical protein